MVNEETAPTSSDHGPTAIAATTLTHAGSEVLEGLLDLLAVCLYLLRRHVSRGGDALHVRSYVDNHVHWIGTEPPGKAPKQKEARTRDTQGNKSEEQRGADTHRGRQREGGGGEGGREGGRETDRERRQTQTEIEKRQTESQTERQMGGSVRKPKVGRSPWKRDCGQAPH